LADPVLSVFPMQWCPLWLGHAISSQDACSKRCQERVLKDEHVKKWPTLLQALKMHNLNEL
jgi:predicted nucleic acid-binding Zn ribbon protein